jgi:hypothetical protein
VSNPIDQLYNRAWYFSLIFEGWVKWLIWCAAL